MNLILAVITLTSVALAHAQQGEKGNSIIPFPRVGRSGGGNSPGLIPFPRIGRDGGGLHEVKRQLIPFPRVGKRAFWHLPVDTYYTEYEDMSPAMMDPSNPNFLSAAFPMEFPSGAQDDNEMDKRSPGQSSGGMWFGPRLGRKKRSVDTGLADSASSEHRETLDTKTLLKILHNFNWAIVPVKERRNFTPRLGRSSPDDSFTIHQRSQPFSPRLGRSKEVGLASSNSELEIDDEPQNRVRLPRMNGATEQPPQDYTNGQPFSPRLGRDPFSPRLGRSGPQEDRD